MLRPDEAPAEVWEGVVGWEGLYEVSDLGRVRRIATGQGTQARVLKAAVTRGYPSCNLCRDGKPKRFLIHRLTCEAFNGPANGLDVNHKDGDRSNGRAENLEWMTPSENMLHRMRVLRTGVHPRGSGLGFQSRTP